MKVDRKLLGVLLLAVVLVLICFYRRNIMNEGFTSHTAEAKAEAVFQKNIEEAKRTQNNAKKAKKALNNAKDVKAKAEARLKTIENSLTKKANSTKLNTLKNTLLSVLGTKVDNATVNTLQNNLTDLLTGKANTNNVNTKLATKANISNVTTKLATKANTSNVTTKLATKANTSKLTELSNHLNNKANTSKLTELSNHLNNKANTSVVNTLRTNLTKLIQPSQHHDIKHYDNPAEQLAWSKGYRGIKSKTKTDKPCQKWTEQSPHGHNNKPTDIDNGTPLTERGIGDHNYCRNPRGNENTIWCYTTDPQTRWEYCQ